MPSVQIPNPYSPVAQSTLGDPHAVIQQKEPQTLTSNSTQVHLGVNCTNKINLGILRHVKIVKIIAFFWFICFLMFFALGTISAFIVY